MIRIAALALMLAVPGLANARGANHSKAGVVISLLVPLLLACSVLLPRIARGLRPVVAWICDFVSVCRKLFTNL